MDISYKYCTPSFTRHQSTATPSFTLTALPHSLGTSPQPVQIMSTDSSDSTESDLKAQIESELEQEIEAEIEAESARSSI